MDKVEELHVSLVGLRTKINENQYKVESAETEANTAADLAVQADRVGVNWSSKQVIILKWSGKYSEGDIGNNAEKDALKQTSC